MLTRCSLIRRPLQFNLETDSDLRYKSISVWCQNVSQSYSQQAPTSSAPWDRILLPQPDTRSPSPVEHLTSDYILRPRLD
ncbi:hypothetical protein C8J56DRAFT_1065744 [Mycena floridula]|nr:hypothetical protein C8J56DRAFT_1065744 [Mycena floridula]